MTPADSTHLVSVAPATTPKRIQLRRAKGWRMPEGAVKVDRTTRFGNPFVVSVRRDMGRAESVRLYRLLLGGYICLSCKINPVELRDRGRWIREHLEELRGKDLACWCPLDGHPCHADVLLELANR